MSGDPVFRRNMALVCAAHLVLIVGLLVAGRLRQSAPRSEITWIQTGLGGGELIPVSLPAESTPVEEEPPPALPDAKPEIAAPPSEIVVSEEKPAEQIVPKIEAPAPPKKAITKPVAPKPKPKPKPKKEQTPLDATKKADEPKPLAKVAAKPNPPSAPPPPASKTAATSSKKAVSSAGKPGDATSGGGGASEFGWYHSMIHDRFYGRWEQPTSIVSSTQKFSSLVRVRIEKDGRISNVSLAKSSGNVLMDESVIAAAGRVTQIDPLPAGLGESHYEININFELNQDQS